MSNSFKGAESQETPQHNTPGRRVIIVEDDKSVLKAIVKFLTTEGYEVTGVSSSGECYMHIVTESYAVAVLDIGLPDQSGLVLAEYIRKNTNMRIIIMSGRIIVDDQLLGYKAGADIYLTKPFSFRILSASIETLLSRIVELPSISPQVVGENEFSPSKSWRLLSITSCLQSPDGSRFKLTNKELVFMTMLASNHGAVVLHSELLQKLGYFNDESGQHSLQALVNRLRHKILTHNTEFPIQAAHGIGYGFFAAIIIE